MYKKPVHHHAKQLWHFGRYGDGLIRIKEGIMLAGYTGGVVLE